MFGMTFPVKVYDRLSKKGWEPDDIGGYKGQEIFRQICYALKE